MHLLALRAEQPMPDVQSTAGRERLHQARRGRRQRGGHPKDDDADAVSEEERHRVPPVRGHLPDPDPPDRRLEAEHEVPAEAATRGVAPGGTEQRERREDVRVAEEREHPTETAGPLAAAAVRAEDHRTGEQGQGEGRYDSGAEQNDPEVPGFPLWEGREQRRRRRRGAPHGAQLVQREPGEQSCGKRPGRPRAATSGPHGAARGGPAGAAERNEREQEAVHERNWILQGFTGWL